MLYRHRFNRRTTCFYVIFLGSMYPLLRILLDYIKDYPERALYIGPGERGIKWEFQASGVDIQKFDFQSGFVRDVNEVEDSFPEEEREPISNGSMPHKHLLKYLIEEPDLCNQHPDLQIISYIHSAVYKKENRQLIRDTWGSSKYYPQVRMKVIFVFGAAASEEEQEIINEESIEHHDIIQLDFLDSYKNLSYKGVSALQWISQHCMHPTWILKSDDDMIINVFGLVDYLNAYALEEAKGNSIPSKIMCAVWWGMPVLRGKGCAKWCVSKEEWEPDTFPTYCSGSAFVIPTQKAPDLYHAYYHAPFLWVDDAYISGVLAKQAGVKHKALHSLYELNHFKIENNLVRGNRIFCHHPGDAKMRAKWWPMIVAKEGYQ